MNMDKIEYNRKLSMIQTSAAEISVKEEAIEKLDKQFFQLTPEEKATKQYLESRCDLCEDCL